MNLSAGDLRFLGLDLTPVFEPGEVEILVGPCADRSRLLVAAICLTAKPAREAASRASGRSAKP
jgi:hypothetical protein